MHSPLPGGLSVPFRRAVQVQHFAYRKPALSKEWCNSGNESISSHPQLVDLTFSSDSGGFYKKPPQYTTSCEGMCGRAAKASYSAGKCSGVDHCYTCHYSQDLGQSETLPQEKLPHPWVALLWFPRNDYTFLLFLERFTAWLLLGNTSPEFYAMYHLPQTEEKVPATFYLASCNSYFSIGNYAFPLSGWAFRSISQGCSSATLCIS